MCCLSLYVYKQKKRGLNRLRFPGIAKHPTVINELKPTSCDVSI